MYNRYIPSADGTYKRQIVPGPERKTETKPPAEQKHSAAATSKKCETSVRKNSFPQKPDLESGDLLVILILLLILLEGEESDPLSLLITMAAFLLLQ